jgi:hypothetical protein
LSPGRACPLHYRYTPSLFREVPTEQATTVYAVGGLYGNPQALAAVLDLKREDERNGPPVTLVFNGDFNWFDVDAESFRNVNETVLAHRATLGNVEAELQGNNDVGCGCAYPDYVDDVTVERSNRIMDRLRLTAACFPDLLARLATLPKVRTFEIGGERVGILHGDPESLAGWHFANDALMPGTGALVAGPRTSETDVARWFSDADVRALLSSHTCLPVMARLFCERSLLRGCQQRRRWHAQLPRRPLRPPHPRVDCPRATRRRALRRARGRTPCGSASGALQS